MREKLVDLKKAAGLVQDGHRVVFHGGMDWTPMAMLRQVVRNGVRDLHTMGVVGGAMNLDFLVGAGATGAVETCSFAFGAFSRVAPNYERWQKAGRVRALDNT